MSPNAPASRVDWAISLVVRIACATILLAGAWFKTWDMLPGSGSSAGVVGLDVGLVSLEFATAWLLLADQASRVMRPVAAGLFFFFALYSTVRWLSGYASCGCFGALIVAPWMTALVDVLAALAMLSIARVEPGELLRRRFRIGIAVGTVLLVGAASLVVAPTATKAGTLRFGRLVLDPSTWPGQRLPIVDLVDWPVNIDRGEWVVVLFSPDCSTCLERVPLYAQQSNERTKIGQTPVVICMIRSNATHEGLLKEQGFTVAKRIGAADWSVPTPMVLRMIDGRVVSAHQ